jgi:hypothetical protein
MRRVARALNELLGPDHSAKHLQDMFEPSTPDVSWLNELAAQKNWIIFSADTSISRNPHEVKAWQEGGNPIFFLKQGWAHQPPWEFASRLFHLFPIILKLAERAKPLDAFIVPFKGEKITKIIP